ncbi:ABC transporter permease [Alterinioella nitratireducens]|uniref:ABC transporter permease n=2 Tax=Alterinioella nitratireducens TaxID=2735915 RepID=UPI001552D951|nr:ABC transporter permease [Alterinioella nitratireducens]NPD21027.1 ABC transporter permease [Alterinioella nitratireducens]
MLIAAIYIALFVAAFFAVKAFTAMRESRRDFTSLKTVTFGDESAVRPNRAASVISVISIFLIWGAFTGSVITPIHAPGPFLGETSFTYTAENAAGERDDATVRAIVRPVGEDAELPEGDGGGDGFARDDSVALNGGRSSLIQTGENDEGAEEEGFRIVAINGELIEPEAGEVVTDDGTVTLSRRGTIRFTPYGGWQMEEIWLPAPEDVWERLIEISQEGYRDFTLAEHLGYSLFRVLAGFALGALIGIPLGYAMGLSNWFRGWFDPIVEFMRPVPPLALIPLVIIWFGIDESGKIFLLFLAALWIMTIAARAGVSGVSISKIHAAYSLGASKAQIMRHVIIPNSLPEIFTGARVAMGVCWGTVVAAELVAAEQGAGQMIVAASKFQLTDIVIMGIILIGIIGYGIDMLMRWAERVLVPWKGKA